MGTHATITVCENGVYRSIFVQSDGYPRHTGRVLQAHYREKCKIDALFERGGVSFLNTKIGDVFDGGDDFPKRPRDFPKNKVSKREDQYRRDVYNRGYTVFMRRDIGDLEDHYCNRVNEYKDYYLAAIEQWNYLFEYGEWWVTGTLHMRDFKVEFNRQKIEKCIEVVEKIESSFNHGCTY